MLYDIQASLKLFIEGTVNVPVVWIYDGVKLPNEKPFITIEDLQVNNETLDKLRDAIQSEYHFQVGIHGQTNVQRTRLQSELKQALLFNRIPLVDTSQPDLPTVGFFDCEIEREVRVPAEELERYSEYHRAYLDVTVTINLYKE